MIIISVIVSSDFRGNQGIGNVIEIMQRRSSVTMMIIIIIMHMISLLSDFGVGLRFSAECDGLTQAPCASLLRVMD